MTSREYDMWIKQILAYTRHLNGERSFEAQMRRAGVICCSCKASLPPPRTPGKKYCAKCTPGQTHRVYMSFLFCNGWQCQFLEENLKTAIRKQVTFRDSQKIREAAERGHSLSDVESRLALDNAIEIGRGGIWLHLTEDQYQTLRKSKQ